MAKSQAEYSLKYLAAAVTAAVLAFAAFPAAAAGQAKRYVSPIYPVHSPLYSISEKNDAATAEPTKRYECESVREDGYIVVVNGARYFAPDDFFTSSEFAGPAPLGAEASDRVDFAPKNLPAEIGGSEFFFNTASAKSFYALAFIIYLKKGKEVSNYVEPLKSFDEFIIRLGSEKKDRMGFLKVLSDFLTSQKIGNKYYGDSTIGPAALWDALRSGRTVVFVSDSGQAGGEVAVFFGARSLSRDAVTYDYYSHPLGIRRIARREAAGLAAAAAPAFLVID